MVIRLFSGGPRAIGCGGRHRTTTKGVMLHGACAWWLALFNGDPFWTSQLSSLGLLYTGVSLGTVLNTVELS